MAGAERQPRSRPQRSLGPVSLSLARHTLKGKESSPRWLERVRGSRQWEAGQRPVPCKVASVELREGLGSGLKGRRSHSPGTSGDLGGLSVPGLVEEEGPARSPHGTSPAQDSRPQPLPKGNSPTTSCSKNSSGCHLRGERNLSLPPGSPLLTRDWNLMAAATSLKREHLCVPEAGGGLGMQPESTLGSPGPAPPFYSPGN